MTFVDKSSRSILKTDLVDLEVEFQDEDDSVNILLFL